MDIKKYFSIKELVCPHVYNLHGDKAWAFFDPRLLDVLYFIRANLGKPITVNNGTTLTQRGYRCNLCELVKTKKTLYCSAHMRGQAIDFDVKGMTADQVRNWLWNNRERLPHNIRLEEDVSWVHVDVCNINPNKIVYFKG